MIKTTISGEALTQALERHASWVEQHGHVPADLPHQPPAAVAPVSPTKPPAREKRPGLYAGERVVTILQACRLAGVSRRTIYHWIAKQSIRYIRTAGGSIRIAEASLFRAHRGGPVAGVVGIQCPACGAPTAVASEQQAGAQNVIARTRVCASCHHEVQTFEVIAGTPITWEVEPT